MSSLTNEARKKYQQIIDGRKGGWFDPGEYEELKQQWFDKFGMHLIEALESYEERAMERDREKPEVDSIQKGLTT